MRNLFSIDWTHRSNQRNVSSTPTGTCVILQSMDGRLIAIAVRTGKNKPMNQVSSSSVTCAAGLAGDSRGKPGKRQITVMSQQAWDAACREVGVPLDWTLRRANVLISGIPLAHQTGKVLRIGDLRLEITGETEPCGNMENAHPGLLSALQKDWRAGVTCRVLQDGTISAGDAVELLDP